MRTVLYANKQLSDFLRDNFVLAWSPERPVPKVSIDFGDGRVLERTITGNAVHYVLDSQGRPLDALPGLYAPSMFMQNLQRALRLAAELKDQPESERGRLLGVYHKSRVATLGSEFEMYARSAHGLMPADEGRPAFPDARIEEVRFTDKDSEFLRRVGTDALSAIRLAGTKARVEAPIALSLTRYDRGALETATDAAMWRKIAYLQSGLVRMDARSIVLMARELPEYADRTLTPEEIERVRRTANPFAAEKAVRLAMSKSMGGEARLIRLVTEAEQSLAQMAGKFEETLAEDSVRNEYTLHARIHDWFANGEVAGLEKLNERVYGEVFLTPRSDPWLGLGARDAYTGIAGGGRGR
jgi:hypothetical protein